jgi:hypothetical protein
MGFKQPRHPIYFHSWLGWTEFFLEAVLGCVTMAQFLNGINGMWFFTLGFTLSYCLFNVGCYCVNMFFFGPYYKDAKAKLRITDKCANPKDLQKRAQQCELTYNQKMANDLMFHNDERHFKLAAIFYAVITISYGIMLNYNGGHVTLQPLASVPTHDDIMAFVFIKGFQLLIMVTVGGLMFLCFDTHSCFMFTQLTSNNKALRKRLEALGATAEDLPVERENHKRYKKDFDL